MSLPLITRSATAADEPEISRLHDKAFGPGRFTRTAYRIREGTPDVSAYCRIAILSGRAVAAVRLTEVTIGGNGIALLLGPLAVDPDFTHQGIGTRLMHEALDAARSAGIRIVLLVGDEPYYGRFGFKPVPMGQITLPGPVDARRLLAAQLVPGTLPDFSGTVAASR